MNKSFIDLMGYKNTKHNIQKMLATQHTIEYLLFPNVIEWLAGS